MNKITHYLLIALTILALQSCSNDDEPKQVDPERISGDWYITNIRGWEYVDDAHSKKSEFNETFDFNGKGIPVGSNAEDAQKVNLSVWTVNLTDGYSIINIHTYYWSMSGQAWKFNESGEVKLQGNQLIDGTMKATITKLTDTSMTTYQNNQYGETYITYTKLL